MYLVVGTKTIAVGVLLTYIKNLDPVRVIHNLLTTVAVWEGL